MSVWVTPRILAGAEDSTTNVRTTRCENARDIAATVRAGQSAWVPVDPWDDVVFEAMVELGSTEAWAKRSIHYARTGVLLAEADFA